MDILRAVRAAYQNGGIFAFSGAGGKTTALFQLARKIVKKKPVLVTVTSHLGLWQISNADLHVIAEDARPLDQLIVSDENPSVILITGSIKENKVQPVNKIVLDWLREYSIRRNIPLLIEADGSRELPLKAPARHEPPIPEFTDTAIVVAGFSALGKALTDENVHRADIFSKLSQTPINKPILQEAILRVLTHPQGGLKNIPAGARRVALLNQCDTPELLSIGGGMARELLNYFDSVIVGSAQKEIFQVFERTAGIILAAGTSTRFGSPKQLLNWKGKPFVRQVAELALRAGLEPVIVVTGFSAAEVESRINDLPVKLVRNLEYSKGQSSSIHAGIKALPKNTGSSIFLLADQPQIPVEVIRALVESHSQNLQPILAPLALGERRANPVLFDRTTFNDLLNLEGDVGGRGIFDKHRVEFLPWHDDILLFDVDKPEDYQRLVEDETL